MHPGWRRCSSVEYGQYAPSSRLASQAPGHSRCDAGFHHGLLDDDALSDALFRARRAVFGREREVVTDACMVLFTLAPSGKVHCRKALSVNSLHRLRATLGPVRRRGQYRSPAPDPRRSTEPGPRRSTRPGPPSHETRTPEHMRPEQSHRPTRSQTTPIQPSRANGADDDGESKRGTHLRTWTRLSRSEMTSSRTTETVHGNSWLPSCRWREPAYSMLNIDAGEGMLRPPSNPRPFGIAPPAPPLAVRRG